MITRVARRGASIFAVLAIGLAVAAFVEVGGALAAAAWLPATRAPVVSPESHRPLRLVAFGDSLAAGFGASPGGGWVDAFRRRLAARAPGSTVANFAVRGARVADVLGQIDRAGPDDANAVFLVSGTNDALFFVDPLSFARDEDAVLVKLRARYPRAALVLTNVPQMRQTAFRRLLPGEPRPSAVTLLGFQISSAFDNVLIDRYARRFGAHAVDFRTLSNWSDPLRDASADGFHPSDRGYALLAGSVWPEVARALGIYR